MKKASKILSLLLSLMIIIGSLPITALAAGNSTVKVIVENMTYKNADWDGVLIDTYVNINQNSTAMTAVADAIKAAGYTQTGAESGYITEIAGLKEFDGGSMSGWIGTINDWFANEGLDSMTVSSGKLADGDEIRMQYSLDWGADIGNSWNNTDTSLKSLSFGTGSVSPEFQSDVYTYDLTLPMGTDSIDIIPTAANKAFQVRIFKGSYTPNNSDYYRNGKNIPVSDGDKLFIGIGNSAWPTSVTAAKTESVYTVNVKYDSSSVKTSDVTFSAQKDGSFIYRPSAISNVSDGIAEEYGYTVAEKDHNGIAINDPTVFDLLVAAHKEKYKDDFTKKTAKNYLDINSSGMITKAFGEAAAQSSFFVNNTCPNDGIAGAYGTTSYMADTARLTDGDSVSFWFYQDSDYWSDYYTYFTQNEVTVSAGSEFTLTLMGFMAMSAFGYDPVPSPINGEDGYITLNKVNSDGSTGAALTDSNGNEYLIDGNGKVKLSLDTPGEYYLTATGFEGDYDSPITIPYCKVTVKQFSDNTPCFDSLNFSTSALSNWVTNQTFSPQIFSYNLNIKTYSTSSLMLMSSTKYDDSKYSAVANYTDQNKKECSINIASGKSTTLANMPFGNSILVIRLSDKNDSSVYTDYTFYVSRPYDTTAAIKNTSGIIVSPNGRDLLKTKYQDYAEGSVLRLDADGNVTGTGTTSSVKSYTTYLLENTKSFTLTVAGSTNYVHFRTKCGDGEWNEVTDGKTPIYSIDDDGKAVITLQAVSDSEYLRNKFNRADSLGVTYSLTVKSIDASSDSAAITAADTDSGNWYPPFSNNQVSYTVVSANDADLPTLTFSISNNASVKLGSTVLTPDKNGKYSLALKTSAQTLTVYNNDGISNDYSFKAMKKSKYDTPDKVVDYLCINSQYTNASYGMNPETTLSGSIKSLGNFGGYITFYYEDAITDNPNNPYGIDFYAYGNSFSNSGSAPESGQVWVSENGKDWYALAGSEHYEDSTITDYEITYSKTASGKTAWFDNRGNSNDGTTQSGRWPTQSVYYMNNLVSSDTFTLSGILIPSSDGSIIGDGTTASFVGTTRFGYVDYFTNGTIGANVNPYSENAASNGFDLAWAVDKNNQPVKFKNGIHYIKVVTASNIWAGSFNEKSTEIGYVVRTTANENEVGKTAAPDGITVASGGNQIASLDFEKDVQTYELYVNNYKDLTISVKNADGNDNIYINNQRISPDGSANVTVGNTGKAIRIIVQNDEKEPLVYVINLVTADMKAVADTEELIRAIGNVTLDSKSAISDARAAYDKLTDEQKALITNLDILEAAEKEYQKLYNQKVATDKEAAESVQKLIADIGDVTLSSKSAIDNARAAYDKLTEDQKDYVDNYKALTNAESTYNKLLSDKVAADKAAAAKADNLISAIGDVTLGSKSAISDARATYDKLTGEQKELTKNYSLLTAAEKKYNQLLATVKSDIGDVYRQAGNYLLSGSTPTVASVGGEWRIIGLARSEILSNKFKTGYYLNVDNLIEKIGSSQLSSSKSTENSRVILALTAAGYDVTKVNGKNLLTPLSDFDFVQAQGINGTVWALIALDSANYEIPAASKGHTQTTRDLLLNSILNLQLKNGAWSLDGEDADIDITAMAIQSLARYYNDNPRVKSSVDNALSYISSVQNSNENLSSYGSSNSESYAQTIIALTALGIDPLTDSRFIKNGNTLFDSLLSFYDKNGKFKHVLSGNADEMATEQAYLALAAYNRLTSKKTSIYNMSDVDADINPASIKLNKTSIIIGVGESYTLKTDLTPSNANAYLTWTSDKPNIVSVSSGKITGKNVGTSTVTVKSANGVSTTCVVTVKSAPASIKLNKTTITLGVGETFDLNSTVNSGSASYVRYWSTSNSSVATVSASIVTAKKSGTSTITVKTYNGKTATCKVTVKPAPTKVTLNKTSITLGVGETFDLNSTVNSGSASYVRNYTSSNLSVATVPGSIINAKKVGTTTITVKTYNGKTATCKVTVKPGPTKVTLNKTSITLGVGETFDLNSTVNSGSASYVRYWSTSNSSVATAPGSIINAKKVGTATITVKTYNGKTATCKVTVKLAPIKVTLNKTSITLGVGETFDLNSTVNSGSASYVRYWSTSNSSVATAPGSIINAKKVGTATITVKTYNGKTATCKVTVKPAPTSIKLNKTSVTLKVGQTYDLNSTVNSGSASYVRYWSTSNSSVATVSASIVKAKKVGTATITVKTYNGKTATCKVTVTK